MSLGLGIALACAALASDGLEPAREAFAAGAYARAEALALEQARPPRRGAALYLAGLARFRAGDAGGALRALDDAGRADDPPPPGEWSYNRGACLYALGRLAEAEEAFRAAAARGGDLAGVALVQAGHAALGRGELERARGLAAEARRVAAGPAAALVEELERDLAQATAARARAADEAGAALWEGQARLGAGWDDNVLQSGLGGRTVLGTSAGGSASLAGTGALSVRRRWRSGAGLVAEASYDLTQVAYAASAVEDLGWQQHGLGLAVQREVAEDLRIGASAGGQLSFTGQQDFRALEGSLPLAAWLALDPAPGLTSRLALRFAPRRGLRSAFAYLGGWRADLLLEQEARLGPATLLAGWATRLERLGVLELEESFALPGCGQDCGQVYRVPLSHLGNGAAVQARVRLGSALELQARGAVEWRRYLEASALRLQPASGAAIEADRRTRQDLRVSGRLGAEWTVWKSVAIAPAWEVLWSRSNQASRTTDPACAPPDYLCHQLDYDDKNYLRQVVGVEVVARW